MIDAFDRLFQAYDVLVFHILHNDHGESAHTEFIHEDILPGYGFQGVWEIAQDIVIDPGGDISQG